MAFAEELVRWSRAAAPREACGLLLGVRANARVRVARALRGRNCALDLDRFELDPGEVVQAHDEAARHGQAVVGVWHSHWRSAARPSPQDLDAAWPGLVQVIVGPVAASTCAVRAWVVETGGIRGVSIDDDSIDLGATAVTQHSA